MNKKLLATLLPVALAAAYGNQALAQDTTQSAPPANEPSLRLAAKLGFQTIGETLYHDEPTIVLKRPAW